MMKMKMTMKAAGKGSMAGVAAALALALGTAQAAEDTCQKLRSLGKAAASSGMRSEAGAKDAQAEPGAKLTPHDCKTKLAGVDEPDGCTVWVQPEGYNGSSHDSIWTVKGEKARQAYEDLAREVRACLPGSTLDEVRRETDISGVQTINWMVNGSKIGYTLRWSKRNDRVELSIKNRS